MLCALYVPTQYTEQVLIRIKLLEQIKSHMLFSHLGEGLCQPFWAYKSNNSSHLNSVIEFIKPFHIYYTFDPQQPGESGMICVIIPFYSSGEVKWFVQTVELLGARQHFQQCSGSTALGFVHSDSQDRCYELEQTSLRPLCTRKIVDTGNGLVTWFPRQQKNGLHQDITQS